MNRDAIDKSQIIPALFEKDQPKDTDGNTASASEITKTCESYGSFLTNSLVKQGLVPESLAANLVPPPRPAPVKKRKNLLEERVISGEEVIEQLKEKEAEEKKRKRKSNRKKERGREKNAQ